MFNSLKKAKSNKAQKIRLFTLAKGGNAKAQYELAMTYLDSSNIEAEYDEDAYDKAAKWFKKAADNDHLDALNAYTKYLTHKISSCQKNLEQLQDTKNRRHERSTTKFREGFSALLKDYSELHSYYSDKTKQHLDGEHQSLKKLRNRRKEKNQKDNVNIKKEVNKTIEDEAREKRNAYQREYRRRKKHKTNIRCFSQTNEQLELIASLWAEGMSAQKISETIGYSNRHRVIATIYHLGLERRGELSEVKPASKTTSQ